MSSGLLSVISKWKEEFPNVVFEHGPSTESDLHHVVSCDGFTEFSMSHRERIKSTLRRHGVWYIDSVTTGGSLGRATVYLNLRRRGVCSRLCARVPCALLCASFVGSVCAILWLAEPDVYTRCVDL